MWQSLPEFGTGVLYAILVCASYTFSVALAAGRGRPRLLRSARLGAYGTSALVLLGVLLLAYAFLTHDFRIRYVARTSEFGMSDIYLLTALWGGQDGSLLWWLFLLSIYISACVFWLKGRYRELQPYIIATLMVIVSFFTVLMLFAANPFETSLAGAPSDGEGLNPLLRNFYMIIHPPSLYTGFVGCSIPFSFAIAALITKRLDSEWIVAVRKWMLFAWLFLSIGNALGMLWAYEVLGWGGYWGWDPVENAACLPWFTASAYVHSTMIQERRNMLKVWNVFLICMTFFLTIFGTFLTRSGLIASVHSFARSDIGIYFVWFMVAIVVATVLLIVLRWAELAARGHIESPLSREAAFLVNNWAFLGSALFIGGVTITPLVTEVLLDHEITFGPPFYNRWMVPMGILLLLLMSVAPLLGWRKTSNDALRKAFTFPLAVMGITALLHLVLGDQLGAPPFVFDEGEQGFLDLFAGVAPLLTTSLVGLNFAVVFQEFRRGVTARRRNSKESTLQALLMLVKKSRRRYGGYIVHIGIGFMFLGFVGKAWDTQREVHMMPGETITVQGYDLKYIGPRMEVDTEKRMIFADLELGGRASGSIAPAKFIYKKQGMPESVVSIRHGLGDDLYVVLAMADPSTKRATLNIHVNPLVSWIWIGILTLICGALISMWPEVSFGELGAWGAVRAATTAAGALMLAILVATTPARAVSDQDMTPVLSMASAAEAAGGPEARSAPGERARAPLRDSPRLSAAGVAGSSFGAIFAGLLLGSSWVFRRRSTESR